MSRPNLDERTSVRPFFPGRPRTSYCIVRQEDDWFIKFQGDQYGPYQTEREAILFAADAANKLGEQGEETQVLTLDENGDERAVWTYGQNPFPPRF
jgi:hypothetical protein